MPDIRDTARNILSAVPPIGQQINSDGSTGPLFTKMTGLTHSYLVNEWAKGSKLTSCNAFTGWYSTTLGSSKYLGRFDLETYLPSIGKGHAWVKSTPDARPKFGDICRHTKFHVGISLDFEGDVWTHVDGGQGGPSSGRDVIKRIRSQQSYDYTKLQGWVDIDLYFGGSAQTALPVPDWLPGWWKVMWRGQAFYYYFDRNHQAKWTQVVPQKISQPPAFASDTASLTIDSAQALTLRWNATGSVEKFNRVGTKSEMKGTWKDIEPLTAARM
jgi:hypothetical protein